MRIRAANLGRLNWIFFGIYVVILVVLLWQGRGGQRDGESRELRRAKPMFFSATFAIVGLALLFPATAKAHTQDDWKNVTAAASLFNLCGVIDTSIIFIQQQRVVPSHFNHTGGFNQILTFIMSALSFALLASVFAYVLAFAKASCRHSHITRMVGRFSTLALALGIAWGFLMIAVGYYQLNHGMNYAMAVSLFGHDLRPFHVVLLLQFPFAMLAARFFENRSYSKPQANRISAAILITAHTIALALVASGLRYETPGSLP